MNNIKWFDDYCTTFNGVFIDWVEQNYNHTLNNLIKLFEEIQVKEYSYACESLLMVHLKRLRRECEVLAKEVQTLYDSRNTIDGEVYYKKFCSIGYFPVLRIYLEANAIRDNWGFFLQSKKQLDEVMK